MIGDRILIDARDPRLVTTPEPIGTEATQEGRLMRHTVADDLGRPETASRVRNFRYIDALAQVGRVDEARERFEDVLNHRNAFGILFEDLHAADGGLSGNGPRTSSTAGIIDSAMRLSQSWEGRR